MEIEANMTDFPSDLRDRWLKLVERNPTLAVAGLSYIDDSYGGRFWYLSPPAAPLLYEDDDDLDSEPVEIADCTAAALCRDAMSDMLERIGQLKTHYVGPKYFEVRLIVDGENAVDVAGATKLAALLAAIEAVMDAKEKSGG